MNTKSGTLAVSLLSGVLLMSVQAANAQTNNPPNTTATRPATTPPGETSIPNNSPPATTTQTTGQKNQDPKIKEMNERAKSKVEREGK